MPHPFLVIAALVTVQVLFGINYIVSKVVVEAFPPLLWASVRIVIATSIMFFYAFLTKRKHPVVNREFLVPLVGFSLLGTIINQSSFLVGLKYTSSTNSAILNTLIPVFTLLVVTLRGQEPLTFKRAMGFFFALSGVLILRKIEDFRLSDETLIGDMLMIVNCLSYAFYLSYSRKFFQTYDRFYATAWLFLYGSIGLGAISTPYWVNFSLPEMTQGLIFAIIFAIVGGTLMTYFLNNWALAYANSSHVALFIYIQPVITAFLAYVLYQEPITGRMMGASGLIFTGMVLGMSKPKA